jgi:hypothetical protein
VGVEESVGVVVGVVGSVGVAAGVLTGAGVLVSSAFAGAASERVAAIARASVADAKAIRRRRGWFLDAPGRMFTGFLSLHMPH